MCSSINARVKIAIASKPVGVLPYMPSIYQSPWPQYDCCGPAQALASVKRWRPEKVSVKGTSSTDSTAMLWQGPELPLAQCSSMI